MPLLLSLLIREERVRRKGGGEEEDVAPHYASLVSFLIASDLAKVNERRKGKKKEKGQGQARNARPVLCLRPFLAFVRRENRKKKEIHGEKKGRKEQGEITPSGSGRDPVGSGGDAPRVVGREAGKQGKGGKKRCSRTENGSTTSSET